MENILSEKNIIKGIISAFILISLYKNNYINILILLLSSLISYTYTKNIDTSLTIGLFISVILYYSTENQIFEGLTSNNSESGKKKKKNKKKNTNKKKKSKEKIPEEEDTKESYIDVGTNFLKAYENLSADQIEGMTKDTKSLIGTQKKLMSTLHNLGPTLKEGKKILDTFKNYFDGDELKK